MSCGERKVQASGGCLCGAITYEIHGPMRPVVNCHCGQCRKTSGHYLAARPGRREELYLTEARGLRWHESSVKARRGFCGISGSSLFWEPLRGGEIMVMTGTLDAPTRLETVLHIFVEDAGDYYEIMADIP